ncbi:MAG: Uma2 family endonuclease [Chroococcidiopsidaceae cyanobacterium CP_BM_RX_35]|nr:Uma2 family endonuclease [Chroococcidiopsidaceae cyanobacterium CP_BM_RX_35]
MTATSPSQISTGMPPLCQWHRATWQDYIALRDAPTQRFAGGGSGDFLEPAQERIKLAFNQGWLWVAMGGEGINHSGVCDLFTGLLFLWAFQHPDQLFTSLGRCLLEKPETQACAPDLVLYVGANYPQWQAGEPRRIDLMKSRVPDLVGEISDTTLASDLDEQKHLYAALGIPEYWVVDVRGQRVFAFLLQENGDYQACSESRALAGLPITLLEETIRRLSEGTNTSAAAWFSQQIANLPS